MRGGTSKAIIFRQDDLPHDRSMWDRIFLAALGSPDRNGRQLDGMGGGLSSLSKVCVIGPSTRPDADVDYTFAQVAIQSGLVDYSGNCGNLSSAIGPFAVDEGLVRSNGIEAVVRIHNTNTHKIIISRFALDDGRAAVDGDFILPGVAGSGAPVRLDFLDPGGAGTGKLLPTGNPVDQLELPDGRTEVSIIDAANPCVFVLAEAMGMSGTELPDELESNGDLLARLEAIRIAASLRMGIATTPAEAARKPSIPKVAMVTASQGCSYSLGRNAFRQFRGRYRQDDFARAASSRSTTDRRNVSGSGVADRGDPGQPHCTPAGWNERAGADCAALGPYRSWRVRAA